MVYLVSDLHGYPIEDIKKKFAEIGFCEKDRLYVLGDCIDRGKDGMNIIKWLMPQPNVTLILGNHEAMLLKNRFLFEGDRIPGVLELHSEARNNYAVWASNGGDVTIDSMGQFTASQIKYMIKYIERAPLYKEIEVGGVKYLLTHSGLGGFSVDKPIEDYMPYDLLWNRPSLNTRYYEDGRIVVFGHTPTVLFGSEYSGRPIFTETWIDIDVGAAMGKRPVILRLDDKKLFYI
ncbi:MAG: metallophosphoesterase [Clostridia bacterium]|nr:metallophosphoesterase [Clostridia bacterium]